MAMESLRINRVRLLLTITQENNFKVKSKNFQSLAVQIGHDSYQTTFAANPFILFKTVSAFSANHFEFKKSLKAEI